MKIMNKKFQLGLTVFYFLVLLGCSAEDEVINTSSTPSQSSPIDLENGTLEISDFIWKGLNEYYYWQGKVELLSDEVAKSEDSYSKFISSNSNPEDFFSKLKHPDDRFSYMYDNYRELENTLEGISSTTGVEFGLLYACQNCNQLIGYVKYILERSNAVEKKHQKRRSFYWGKRNNSEYFKLRNPPLWKSTINYTQYGFCRKWKYC